MVRVGVCTGTGVCGSTDAHDAWRMWACMRVALTRVGVCADAEVHGSEGVRVRVAHNMCALVGVARVGVAHVGVALVGVARVRC